MSNNIKTTHKNFDRYYYFILEEKLGAISFFLWGLVLCFGLYFLLTSLFKESSNPMVEFVISGALTLTVILILIVILSSYVWPAYSRARFLRNKGFCIITPDIIEAHYLGKIESFEYKGRSIKSKHHKDGSTDIFIGKGFSDLIKHSGFVFSSKFFEANRAARGFGAPLWRVTNADEVVRFLEANK